MYLLPLKMSLKGLIFLYLIKITTFLKRKILFEMKFTRHNFKVNNVVTFSTLTICDISIITN